MTDSGIVCIFCGAGLIAASAVMRGDWYTAVGAFLICAGAIFSR